MKKDILMLAAIVCCCSTIMAEPVSPAAAAQVAAKFLHAKGATLKDEPLQAMSRTMTRNTYNKKLMETSPCYVFNADDNRGFVVVSGDDCVGDNNGRQRDQGPTSNRTR